MQTCELVNITLSSRSALFVVCYIYFDCLSSDFGRRPIDTYVVARGQVQIPCSVVTPLMHRKRRVSTRSTGRQAHSP